MKELGGFFELEFAHRSHFHHGALALNSARSCLGYIIRARRPNKIYVPAYSCETLLEPLFSKNIQVVFYHIDDRMELSDRPKLQSDELLIYINYFGIKGQYLTTLHQDYEGQLIIDNTQAFFEKPLPGVDTFYSPRKFLGVSDGGFLFTDTYLDETFEKDTSKDRFLHLLGRHEDTASEFYNIYREVESHFSRQPIMQMSELTQGILNSLDYRNIANVRQRNFWALHSQLNGVNLFPEIPLHNFVPLAYPFMTSNRTLRQDLVDKNIYSSVYWTEALERCNAIERKFIDETLPLPIDQRCTMVDLERIKEAVYGG